MRNGILIVLLIGIAAAAAQVISSALGWHHPRELALAAVICLIASIAGLIPMHKAMGKGVIPVSLSGLFGTLLHMLVALVLAAIVWKLFVTAEWPFIYLLVGFYWLSLAALALTASRLIKQASAQQAMSMPLPPSAAEPARI